MIISQEIISMVAGLEMIFFVEVLEKII